jgi:hypothetical protein
MQPNISKQKPSNGISSSGQADNVACHRRLATPSAVTSLTPFFLTSSCTMTAFARNLQASHAADFQPVLTMAMKI